MTGRVTPITRERPTPVARPTAAGTRVSRTAVLVVVPVVLLLVIGLGAMLSASSVVSIRTTGDPLFYFKRQVVWVGLGLAALVITVRVPYRWYRTLAGPLYAISVAGLVATLAIGDVRNGARRWIELGPVTLQLAEMAKLSVVLFLAAVLVKKERWLGHLLHLAVPVIAIVGPVALLLLLQPDFGNTVLLGAAALAVMAVSVARVGHVVGLATTATVVGGFLAFAEPYRRQRLTAFLDPWADPLGSGLQAVQSLVALGTGGWIGVGLGASRARWSFLPNAHTDFIFAIIGEETGLVGSFLVIGLFVLFTVVGVRIAMRAPDAHGRLLAAGIVTWLALQAVVNVGGVTALLPITGVPLPFVSSGGNAMVVNLAAVGILVNIARTRREDPLP